MDLPGAPNSSVDDVLFFKKIRNVNTESKPIHEKNCAGFVRVLPTLVADNEIATFPFTTDFEDEISLSSYFKTEQTEDGIVSGTFRGRLLHGERVQPPNGCGMYVSEGVLRPNGQKLMNITGVTKHIMSYEYDRQPGPQCRLQTEMAELKNSFHPELSKELQGLTRKERVAFARASGDPAAWQKFVDGYMEASPEDRAEQLKAFVNDSLEKAEADDVIHDECGNLEGENKPFADLFPALASRFGYK
ncbi:hypothetical protein FO519_004778 [Halicephalobus sp. NKZ332]|nr:hypothetical protein FO519_004778 [Halicephalobus sp. NKZ332]